MSLSVYEVGQACCEQQAIGSQVWGEAKWMRKSLAAREWVSQTQARV